MHKNSSEVKNSSEEQVETYWNKLFDHFQIGNS